MPSPRVIFGQRCGSCGTALTHCHVLARKDPICLNSHPKACHIVNVKDDDHLKYKHRTIRYIALIMLIESALLF